MATYTVAGKSGTSRAYGLDGYERGDTTPPSSASFLWKTLNSWFL